jgi:Family of unknown function (DUF6497)
VEDLALDITLGDGAAVAVPSGQSVTLLDIIWNSEGPEGPAPRFRFVAPAIARDGGSISYDAAEADLQHLCEGFVMAQLAERGLDAPLVLLAMADRAVEFGIPDPEATQYVDAFRIEGTTCIREIF